MPPTGPTPSRRGRSRRERLAISGAVLVACLCFASAGALAIGYAVVRDRTDPVVSVRRPAASADAAPTPTPAPTASDVGPTSSVVPSPASTSGPPAPPSTAPPGTFPPTSVGTSNILVVGVDGECGASTGATPEADLLMMVRVDGPNRQLAMLSFPPELYLPLAGGRGRAALGTAGPGAVVDTLYENFAIATEHVLQLDRCAFSALVDAIGGVTIPFAQPARDVVAGLDVPEPGCVTLDGEAAVAYVGSQRFEYRRPIDGVWTRDPSAAAGRLTRQQELMKRALSGVVADAALSPGLVRGLLGLVAGRGLVLSEGLTVEVLIDVGGIARELDPASVPTYRVEGEPRRIDGRVVLAPRIDGEDMQAILRLFRSEASTPEPPPRSNGVGVGAPDDVECP